VREYLSTCIVGSQFILEHGLKVHNLLNSFEKNNKHLCSLLARRAWEEVMKNEMGMLRLR